MEHFIRFYTCDISFCDIPTEESIYIQSHAEPFVVFLESNAVDEVNIFCIEDSEDEEKDDEEEDEVHEIIYVDELDVGSSSSKRSFQQMLTSQLILLNHIIIDVN